MAPQPDPKVFQPGLFQPAEESAGARPVRARRSEQPLLVVGEHLETGRVEGAGLLVLPNSQAARALNVPYTPLDGLARRVLEDSDLHVATPLTAARLLHEAVGTTQRVQDPAGLARSLENTIRELLRAGVDFAVLAAWEQPRVRRLGEVGRAYRRLLRDERLVDHAEVMWVAADLVEKRRTLTLAGFPRLPAAERTFLDALCDAESTVHLPAGHASLFAENEAAVADFVARGWRLERAGSGARPLGNGEQGPAGARLLAARFAAGGPAGESAADAGRWRSVSYADTEAEVRGTLAQVKELLLEGVSPKDIAIVARHEEAYGDQLISVAREFGVPVRALYSLPLTRTRVGALLSLLFEVLREGWPFESTARLLGNALVRRLESRRWPELRLARPEGAEAWAQFAPALAEAWPEEATVKEYRRRLQNLLDALGVRGGALHWPREAEAYGLFIDGLRELPAGTEKLTFEQFLVTVAELCRHLTVPAHPGRGGVELHTPLSLFGAPVAHLFVLGANEGSLPDPVRPDPLLDAFEREELQSAGVPVEDVATAARREALSFWALLHSATETLTISHPRLLGGREALPSPFLARLGLATVADPERPLCSPEEVRIAELHTGAAAEEPVLSAARRAFAVELRRESSARPDEYDGVTGVPYSPPEGGLGVTRLGGMAGCAFKFFAGTLLRLDEPAEGPTELEPALRGKFYHRVLQLVVEPGLDGEEVRRVALQRLEGAFEEAAAELELTRLASWPLERGGHLRVLGRAVRSADFVAEGARVLHLEQEFSSTWRGIPVRGRVDRLDELDGRAQLVDYKAGKGVYGLAKDETGKATVDLQLPIYSEAATRELLGEHVSATSRYFSVSAAEDLRVKEPPEEELERIAGAIASSWHKGEFPVDPDVQESACSYCPFDPLCRKGPRLERKRASG